MIHEIGNGRFDNQYKNRQIKSDDIVLIYRNREIVLKEINENGFAFFTYEESKFIFGDFEYRFLFSIDDKGYYLLCVQGEYFDKVKRRFNSLTMREIRGLGRKEDVFAATTGWHIFNWYKSNRFCGSCGERTVHDTKERMLRCPKCNNMIFPKISPAVIVGVKNKDKLLMTKYAGREYKRYALVAGFTEIGESVEETVVREVLEEAGIKVKNITYYKSQPWGFDSDILMGYYCEVDGDETIIMDESELSVAEWVHYNDIPEYNEGLSLTEDMMINFKRQKEKENA